jgi:hypothetical protein
MSREVDEYLLQARRRQERWEKVRSVAAIGGLVAILGAGLVTVFVEMNGCQAGDDRALSALRSSGLRDPKLGAADVMGCAESESSRHFTATNSLDQRVEGTVCCGLTGVGKGCTIRWGR